MTDACLTDELAARVLGWRLAPDRYIKPGRSWIPRSRFRPLVDVNDAFRLLNAVTKDFTLSAITGGAFTAEVRIGGRVGRATGEPKARAITLAVAGAIGLDPGRKVGGVPTAQRWPVQPRKKERV